MLKNNFYSNRHWFRPPTKLNLTQYLDTFSHVGNYQQQMKLDKKG